MTTLVDTSLVGLEDIQRGAFLRFLENINDYIAEIELRWHEKDEDVVDRINELLPPEADLIVYEPTTLERIQAQNVHEGHWPSLIVAPVDRYPNLAVMAYRATPTPDSASLDHGTVYADNLRVEVMVRAGNEEEANRRAQRTAEAAVSCLMADTSLGGVINGFQSEPTVELSNVTTRREKVKGHYGSEWFWQGARITCAVRKESVVPSPDPTGSFFRAASPDIDQG